MLDIRSLIIRMKWQHETQEVRTNQFQVYDVLQVSSMGLLTNGDSTNFSNGMHWLATHLTHCGLVTPYGDRDMDQHWLR